MQDYLACVQRQVGRCINGVVASISRRSECTSLPINTHDNAPYCVQRQVGRCINGVVASISRRSECTSLPINTHDNTPYCVQRQVGYGMKSNSTSPIDTVSPSVHPIFVNALITPRRRKTFWKYSIESGLFNTTFLHSISTKPPTTT